MANPAAVYALAQIEWGRAKNSSTAAAMLQAALAARGSLHITEYQLVARVYEVAEWLSKLRA